MWAKKPHTFWTKSCKTGHFWLNTILRHLPTGRILPSTDHILLSDLLRRLLISRLLRRIFRLLLFLPVEGSFTNSSSKFAHFLRSLLPSVRRPRSRLLPIDSTDDLFLCFRSGLLSSRYSSFLSGTRSSCFGSTLSADPDDPRLS